ncbi:putative polyamine transporter [Aspergillus flavus AF70]|nr:putative polyamine transporter [Aspergillus flavus AF70]
MSAMEQEDKHPSPDVMIATGSDQSSEYSKRNDNGIVLIPQPSDDPEDPLNWPMRKKIIIFACICLAGFAGQMSPNSNQLTFVYQIPAYHKTQTDLLNSVAAGLAGWVAGPFFIIPLVAVIGRSSVVLWSLVAIFACQIWAAEMTGANDYISFTISRLFCGMFGGIPAILGSGYIMDMFYLHQRGKAFAIFEVLIIFAVVGGGTLGGFIAEHKPWNYVFWWTLGPVGAAILAVFFFVEDTTFPRDPSMPKRAPLPKGWFANRIATFLPGTKTQPSGKGREFVRKAITPLQITFTPITLLTGTYIFIALGLPIMQASTLATYLEPPEEAGGYGFSSLQMAFFTMTAWVGIISAQVYGFFFNDKTPLWLARRRGGTWHTEYRLANTILPSIILPIGLGIYGAGLEYHLHFMVLALGSFLIWFGALLALPVCYNYIIECFLNNPVEASVSLNAYRVSFGLMSVFIVTQWQSSVGVGWMWGMGAFLIVFVDLIMAGIILKGHLVRKWTATLGSSLDVTEDGANISAKKEGGV